MKAIGAVYSYDVQHLQLLLLYWDPGKAHSVALYRSRESCIQNIPKFMQSNHYEYTYGDNQGHFITGQLL